MIGRRSNHFRFHFHFILPFSFLFFSITLKIVKISKTIIPKSKTTIFLFIPSQRRSHSVQCLFEPGMHMLTPIRGQHMIALEYVARSDAPCSASARSGQTGLVGRSDRFCRGARQRSNERSGGRDPVRASAPWVALDSAGQLGRPQTPWRREKNSILRLENKR